MECSKTVFCDNAMAKTLTQEWFSSFVPPYATQMKTCRKFQKSSIKTNEVPFQRLLSGYASHTEHAQSMPLLFSDKQK